MAAYLTIPAYGHGGYLDPLGIVMHSAQTPLLPGYAVSIARNVFAVRQPNPANQTSATGMVDPQTVVRMLPDNVIAWHCGNGNQWTLGWEQAGYAEFSRSTWLSPLGLSQMDLLAAEFRAASERHGIPKRWATTAEARAGVDSGRPFGYITHAQASEAWGGSSHWDPGPDYPKDVFINKVNQEDDMTPEQDQMLRSLYSDNHLDGYPYGKIAAGFNDGRTTQSLVKTLTDDNHIEGYGFGKIAANFNDTRANGVMIAALTEVVKQLAKGQGIDEDALTASIKASVEKALTDVTITLKTEKDEH